MNRVAFTLLEIMATLLLVAFGLVSVLGMVQYAARVSADAQSRATAMLTGRTILVDPQPFGLVADLNDANGDDWRLEAGSVTAPAGGDYSFTVYGWVNGYQCYRTERSTVADIVDGQTRMASITVTVYADGEEFTTLRRRLVRRTVGP